MGLFSKKSNVLEIHAPVDGKIISLDEVKDDIFSQRMLGDGFAIAPKTGNFIAPFDGKLVTVFPTGHAYGLKHKSGVETLIHIGLDTVTLEGKGFDIKVSQDEKVKQGDILVNVDLDEIKDKVPAIDTSIVFTPESLGSRKIEIVKTGDVKQGEIVAIIKK